MELNLTNVNRTFAITGYNKVITTVLISIMVVQCCVVIDAMSRPGQNQGMFSGVKNQSFGFQRRSAISTSNPFDVG